ncbi:hypothetical protein RISK_000324 [Rhodopirellula islandica]|uniref:Uncharacterized protein n=1 Tax=Rhodopirellula islandica TaxID=595434 RepID=A0A0J1BMD7_RHOIS|nr:hypothetical protein RISK_000324 [Rhodopirellula islandica]
MVEFTNEDTSGNGATYRSVDVVYKGRLDLADEKLHDLRMMIGR